MFAELRSDGREGERIGVFVAAREEMRIGRVEGLKDVGSVEREREMQDGEEGAR